MKGKRQKRNKRPIRAIDMVSEVNSGMVISLEAKHFTRRRYDKTNSGKKIQREDGEALV